MYDIIVIGAGPAGLTAAIYARRSNKSVLVLEAISYGGQLVNILDIENYPGYEHINGVDLASKLYEQAVNLGSKIVFERVIDIRADGREKEIITSKNSYKCKSVIIATGSENRKLGLDNESKLIGKGVSYCATCDGNFYKNKVVAVVGGGKVAMDDAMYLSNIASLVYLIHSGKTFKDDDGVLSLLEKKDNIRIMYESNVTKLNAKDKLDSIEVTDNKGKIQVIDVSGLFIAIGRIPENENFRKLIELNEKGYIVTTENCHTNVAGIFAAGDNRVKMLRQVVTATSDGAIAAVESIKYINREWRNKNV